MHYRSLNVLIMTTDTKHIEVDLIRKAITAILQQDITTSVVDLSLKNKISNELQALFERVRNDLVVFSKSASFKLEQTRLQYVAISYRMLMIQTLAEFTNENENVNRISPDQMVFLQNLAILGGKLQSFNQLIATSSNSAKIYDRLREASVLSELTGKEAIEFLRSSTNDKSDLSKRTDIKEISQTSRKLEDLSGIDDIIQNLKQILMNMEIGLVSSFLFIIFYGVPGTGKTAISEGIAGEFSKGEYYKFDQSFFAAPYIGVAESRIRNIFETIRTNTDKNYTIIIDEGDNVLGSSREQSHLNSIKILLQTEISSTQSFGRNLILICITNYLNRIDQTFLRRSTNIIEVPPPGNEDCLKFLESQLTTNLFVWNDTYKRELIKYFRSDYIYTNSDMTRLAKNIQDNFIYLYTPDDIVKVFIIQEIACILFWSVNYNWTYPVDKSNSLKPHYKPVVFIGIYNEVMRQTHEYLSDKNLDIFNYSKYFAPCPMAMQTALSKASTLTREGAAQFTQVPL